MEQTENFELCLNGEEHAVWDTEPVFKPVSEWHEEDGVALFFRLDTGEPPTITSPLSSTWDKNYFTHWMALPDEFGRGYRLACIKSGIATTYR